MPSYDYRCKTCGTEFVETHDFDAPLPDCPECESVEIQRIIKNAPTVAKGILTPAGDSRKSSKEQLQDKWREETPKLRKQLQDKLGEDVIKNIPSLNFGSDDD